MTTIITKNSSTASAVPLAADLVQGELAVNVTDKKLYTKNASGVVVEVSPKLSNITSGTAVNSTSGTAIDFTNIPSGVKRITVVFSGVSTNGTSIPQFQLGAGSVTTTGYVATSTGFQLSNSLVSSVFTTGFPLAHDNSAPYSSSGTIVFTNITSNTWVGSLVGSANNAGTGRTMHGGGTITLSGTLDRVRITTVNGTDTFDAGSINILYEV